MSLALLAHEIVILRLLAFAQWAHVGYLVVGVALVGFGAAGVATALRGWRLSAHARRIVTAGAVLFALCQGGSYLLLHRFSFNTLALLWDGREIVKLAVVSAALAITFFFGALVIAAALATSSRRVGRVYAMNLFGSAGGAILGVALYAHSAIRGGALVAGALLAGLGLVRRARGGTAVAACGISVALLALAAMGVPAPRVSEYKGLARLLQQEGAKRVATETGLLSQLDVIEPGRMPLRYAPGLSILSPEEIPRQLAFTRDASPSGALTEFRSPEELAFLDWTLEALGPRLRRGGRLAVLGLGSGYEALYGRHFGLEISAACEMDASVTSFLRSSSRGIGETYERAVGAVEVEPTCARKFAEEGRGPYDVVILAEEGGELSGLSATEANFIHTVEGYRKLLQLLSARGILSIRVRAEDPPRAWPRVLATLAAAARAEGIRTPAEHIAAVRDALNVVVLYNASSWDEEELKEARAFAEGRAFDLVWLPDMRPEESERFIQREEARGPGTPALPGSYEAARALLGDGADDFLASYPFRVAPATDDRPFFHHHFRWGALTQILRMGTLGVAHLEFGYALAVAFLLVAAVLALVGTFAPILAAGAGARAKGWAAGIGYFFAIGLAYMMVEMTTMLRIERAVGHPVLAMATTV
ncbi:MAG: hypothetical protein V2A58_07235, partial [Planctomycetota bacterium]